MLEKQVTLLAGWLPDKTPILGIIFLPWTTIIYVIVAPGGVVGFDRLWLGLMLVADILWYTGGGFRKRIPGYEGY